MTLPNSLQNLSFGLTNWTISYGGSSQPLGLYISYIFTPTHIHIYTLYPIHSFTPLLVQKVSQYRSGALHFDEWKISKNQHWWNHHVDELNHHFDEWKITSLIREKSPIRLAKSLCLLVKSPFGFAKSSFDELNEHFDQWSHYVCWLNKHLVVSWIGGTPKSSIFVGISIMNWAFWVPPWLWKPPFWFVKSRSLDRGNLLPFQPLALARRLHWQGPKSPPNRNGGQMPGHPTYHLVLLLPIITPSQHLLGPYDRTVF